MIDADNDADIAADLPGHRETYANFGKLVLFAALHIALVLVSLALAFPGHVPVFATFLGIGGTLALIAAFALSS